jgi:hypothetical protein
MNTICAAMHRAPEGHRIRMALPILLVAVTSWWYPTQMQRFEDTTAGAELGLAETRVVRLAAVKP